MEDWELVSHSRTWRFLGWEDWRDARAWWSRDRERTVLMTVLDGSELSWVVNSRPRPRLAPVMIQVGILGLGLRVGI